MGPLIPLSGDVSSGFQSPEWAALFELCRGAHVIRSLGFTCGATPADLLVASMVAELSLPPVFSLTLARSPMASRSYRRASDFLNYSPGLASDILAERKSEKKKKKFFFKKMVSPSNHDTVAFQKLI